MENLATDIVRQELRLIDFELNEIVGLGKVNKVFIVTSQDGDFILRLNNEAHKTLEFRKEKWCIDTVKNTGVPSPTVLKIGTYQEVHFMLQRKIPGMNGSHASIKEKLAIWRSLGTYARIFQQIPRIADTDVEEDEFHASWRHRLRYNIEELNEKDSLLSNGVVSKEDHAKMKTVLSALGEKEFATGLVHGDLCPRNSIWQEGKTFLIDWGMAEINIVPHNEIGIALLSGEANSEEFRAFLDGLGLSKAEYARIEPEVKAINFLHHLDKYRWAKDYSVNNIGDYEKMVVSTFRTATFGEPR